MKRWKPQAVFFSVFTVCLLAISYKTPAAQGPDDGAQTLPANCRYGIATVDRGIPSQVDRLPAFGAGWYMTFGVYPPETAPANGAEFVHYIHLEQERSADGTYLPAYTSRPVLDEQLADYLRQHPGGLWLAGNEVERGPPPGEIEGGQGDIQPDMYATVYHDVYHFVKRHDPTAQVIISGLVQVTPGRLQYLDKFWQAYKEQYGTAPPVDVWSMHLYILPEVRPDGVTPNNIANVALGTDPRLGKRGSGGDATTCSDPDVYCFAEHDDLTIFAEQVSAMRAWMKEHGQQQKPLLMTEFSLLYPYQIDGDTCFVQDEYGRCFDPRRVSRFMTGAFDYLNQAVDPDLGYSVDKGRLVQQWMWFSMHTRAEGSGSNLVEADFQTLTEPGRTFRDYVGDEPLYADLVVEATTSSAAFAVRPTATGLVEVIFRNRGNTAVTQPFDVTFYADARLTQPIGTVSVEPPVNGCAAKPVSVGLPWPDLRPGLNRYWVKLDRGGKLVGEGDNPADNVGSGFVFVWPLPTIVAGPGS